MHVACEVAYAGPRHGWYTLDVDPNNFQIGDARYFWHQRDAIRDAIAKGVPVTVFDRQGRVRKIIAV